MNVCLFSCLLYIYIYIYIYICYVTLLTQISLLLSRHSSLYYITSSRSSRLHPVSILCCCGEALVYRPTLAHPCEGVHWKTSLMSSSLLLLQCLAYFVRWMVLEIGDRLPDSYCFLGCCIQDLFNIHRGILVQFQFIVFSIHLVSIHVVHLYSRTDITTAWKKLCFILSEESGFHMIDNLSIAVHAFTSRILMPFSVDETLLSK